MLKLFAIGFGFQLLVFVNADTERAFACFWLLSFLKLCVLHRSLVCLALQTLNGQRLFLLCQTFFEDGLPERLGTHTFTSRPSNARSILLKSSTLALSPAAIAKKESLVWSCLRGTNRLSLRLGVALREVHGEGTCQAIRWSSKDVVYIASDGTIRIVLHEGASNKDIIRAFFNTYSILKRGTEAKEDNKRFLAALEAHKWDMTKLLLMDHGHRESWRVVTEREGE